MRITMRQLAGIYLVKIFLPFIAEFVDCIHNLSFNPYGIR